MSKSTAFGAQTPIGGGKEECLLVALKKEDLGAGLQGQVPLKYIRKVPGSLGRG